MKRITIVRALAALAVLASLAVVTPTSKHTVPVVYASPPASACGNATLTGNYAFIQPAGLTTRAVPTGSEIVPWQFAGVANFDGQGTFSFNYTAAVNNGVYTGQTAAGSYTVGPTGPNSECTGAMTVAIGNAVGTMANVYIVGGGQSCLASSRIRATPPPSMRKNNRVF